MIYLSKGIVFSLSSFFVVWYNCIFYYIWAYYLLSSLHSPSSWAWSSWCWLTSPIWRESIWLMPQFAGPHYSGWWRWRTHSLWVRKTAKAYLLGWRIWSISKIQCQACVKNVKNSQPLNLTWVAFKKQFWSNHSPFEQVNPCYKIWLF